MPKLFSPLRRGGGGIASAALASLALAAGALAASAPAASASIMPDCGWNQLSLMNGWQSDQNTYGTGDPRYCVTRDGMVHLSGSLTQPSAGAGEFAALPPQAWPASNLYLSVYTMDGTAGYLMIDTAGRMYAYSGPDGDAPDFTSLAGVSFPGASVAQQPLALLNGWQSAQGQWGTGDPSYSVTNGIVHLSGSLNGSQVTPGLQSEAASTFAVLPQGARPDFCTGTEAYTYAGVPGTLQVDPLGMMYAYAQGGAVYNSPSAQYTSLAGVSFPAAGTTNWHALSLQSTWSPVVADWCKTNVDTDPAWDVINGMVYLTGWMSSSVSNSGEVTVLPPAARPVHTLYLILNEGPAPHASLEIQPNGAVIVFGAGPVNGVDSLAGLSYELTS